MHLYRLVHANAGSAERADARLIKNRLRQVILSDGLRRALLNAAQHEHRHIDARLPQLDAFLRNGHSQHGCACIQRRQRHRHRAMAVSVRLDNRQKICIARRLFAHDAHIVADRVQIDFTHIVSEHMKPAFFSAFLKNYP